MRRILDRSVGGRRQQQQQQRRREIRYGRSSTSGARILEMCSFDVLIFYTIAPFSLSLFPRYMASSPLILSSLASSSSSFFFFFSVSPLFASRIRERELVNTFKRAALCHARGPTNCSANITRTCTDLQKKEEGKMHFSLEIRAVNQQRVGIIKTKKK